VYCWTSGTSAVGRGATSHRQTGRRCSVRRDRGKRRSRRRTPAGRVERSLRWGRAVPIGLASHGDAPLHLRRDGALEAAGGRRLASSERDGEGHVMSSCSWFARSCRETSRPPAEILDRRELAEAPPCFRCGGSRRCREPAHPPERKGKRNVPCPARDRDEGRPRSPRRSAARGATGAAGRFAHATAER
jgi:hypothetical protein